MSNSHIVSVPWHFGGERRETGRGEVEGRLVWIGLKLSFISFFINASRLETNNLWKNTTLYTNENSAQTQALALFLQLPVLSKRKREVLKFLPKANLVKMPTVPAPHLFFKNARLKEPKRFGHLYFSYPNLRSPLQCFHWIPWYSHCNFLF